LLVNAFSNILLHPAAVREKASEIMNIDGDPSTPETERAGDSDATPLEDEIEAGNEEDDAEKLTLNTDLDESTPAISDKPPTPMPE
jgi:hypothetical protein